MNESDVFALFGVGMMLFVYIAIIIVALAISIAFLYPYFRMARNQGLPHAWLAFIPIGNLWVVLNLSRREFNLFNKYIQTDRTKVFWHFLIATAIFSVLLVPVVFIAMIPVLGWIIYFVFLAGFSVISYGVSWRMYYDLYLTYGMGENAMVLSVLGLFVPIIPLIAAFIIMNNQPDFEV